MALLAQIGYGRGNKVEDAFDEGLLSGVIMSPRDESRTRLETFINSELPEYENYIALFDLIEQWQPADEREKSIMDFIGNRALEIRCTLNEINVLLNRLSLCSSEEEAKLIFDKYIATHNE